MESLKAKYNIGTRVKYKLNNPNIPIQFGIIKGSYYNYLLYMVYYTILKDDGTTSEVPEELIIEDYGYETFD
jgi:hypothetical protein